MLDKKSRFVCERAREACLVKAAPAAAPAERVSGDSDKTMSRQNFTLKVQMIIKALDAVSMLCIGSEDANDRGSEKEKVCVSSV
ncbi:hypothetical protein EVAR_28210_1 [Eumeta japonica]|uniref:Uncharacterized protein n=1 Tax=Eumeta variegata TaxID=151549 RepID=A0A4C1VJ37_EUMVA|nr:hypothetical protein EVAR_28210_1 [Eumeta japonica]